MPRSGVVIDRDYLRHDPGPFHPERPQRLKILLALAGGLDRRDFALLSPRQASKEEIEACHSSDYLRLVQATSEVNRYALDGDTVTCRDSFGVGLLAVGGFLELLDAIAGRELRNGFALVRPPGHHALKERAMGFCLFNTVAIGAHYLKLRHGARRILIVDWDVHHGNGTQDAFYHDASVLYLSIHQYPYYPGSGAIEEIGAGAGRGFTVNVPLPAGCGDQEYLRVFDRVVLPVGSEFAPDWILVSAGFDPHKRDPLGGMNLSEKGFAAMAAALLDLAARAAGGKIAFLLEGGYDLDALKGSVASVLEQMRAGGNAAMPARGGEAIEPVIREVLRVRESCGRGANY